ncbi:hypothetical protein Tco_0222258 [Tanacetum coccineum]
MIRLRREEITNPFLSLSPLFIRSKENLRREGLVKGFSILDCALALCVIDKISNSNKREELGEKPIAKVNIEALHAHMHSSQSYVSDVLQNMNIRVPFNLSATTGVEAVKETTTSLGELPIGVTMNPSGSLDGSGAASNPNMGKNAINPITNAVTGLWTMVIL